MDDIFETFKTYKKQLILRFDHFFLCMILSKLKFAFSKLKIDMTKIFALEEKHEIERRISLKPDKIEIILP